MPLTEKKDVCALHWCVHFACYFGHTYSLGQVGSSANSAVSVILDLKVGSVFGKKVRTRF